MKISKVVLILTVAMPVVSFADDEFLVSFKKIESGEIHALSVEGSQAETFMDLLPNIERAADGSIETNGTIRCNRTAQIEIGIHTECTLVTK